jgi:hypothetical protein
MMMLLGGDGGGEWPFGTLGAEQMELNRRQKRKVTFSVGHNWLHPPAEQQANGRGWRKRLGDEGMKG